MSQSKVDSRQQFAKAKEEQAVIVEASPHINGDQSTRRIMGLVVLALVPAMIASGVFFGWRVYLLYLIAILSAQAAEWLWYRWRKQTMRWDLSAVVTAVLLTMNLPPSAPWYFPLIGSVFAIIFAKEFFGGIGHNFINPALAGRALLVGLFFEEMFRISWPAPPFGSVAPDAVTQATPLAAMRSGEMIDASQLWSIFIGTIGGRTGETSSLLLLIGGVFLLWRGVINWRIPVIMLVTIGLGGWLFGGHDGLASIVGVLGYVFSGGAVLGAFFMATDYASSPATSLGEGIFAFFIGVLVIVFRYWGLTYEGVSYAILIMNCFVPLIDYLVRPRVLGEEGTASWKFVWKREAS